MKPTALKISAGLALAFLPGLASALNIGVIRAQDVVTESPQYERAEQRMRNDFERRAEQLQREANRLQEDIGSFRQEADLLSAGDRERRQQELATRSNDFELKQRQFREDVQNRERELFEDIMDKIRTVIERVARERDLDVIFPDAVYVAPRYDLTDIVLEELRKLDN